MASKKIKPSVAGGSLQFNDWNEAQSKPDIETGKVDDKTVAEVKDSLSWMNPKTPTSQAVQYAKAFSDTLKQSDPIHVKAPKSPEWMFESLESGIKDPFGHKPAKEGKSMLNLKLTNRYNPPATQKARGIWTLTKTGYGAATRFPVGASVPESYLVTSPEDLALTSGVFTRFAETLGSDVFARPCPTVPRHGFVESRMVVGPEDLAKVWAEARAADEKAEVLLMPRINAATNIILVVESGVLSIGPGHDGATGGKDSISFPVTPNSYWDTTGRLTTTAAHAAFRKDASIKDGEDIYIEAVVENGEASFRAAYPSHVYLVQARSGPKLAAGQTEFIPKATTIAEIITPTDDLLAWEKLVHDKKDTPGVVAWAPKATLACHAAVHCVVNNIPFLTREDAPKVGTDLAPTEDKVPPFDEHEFLKGLSFANYAQGNKKDIEWCYAWAPAAITWLHNAVAMRSSHYYSRLLGWAAGTMFKLGALACIGERRHYGKTDGGPRREKYREFVAASYVDLAHYLRSNCVLQFLHEDEWGGGYGGFPWAVAAVETVKLYHAIESKDPNKILAQMNVVVNTAHNGGNYLNKFATGPIFDTAALLPTRCAVAAAPIWYDVVRRNLDDGALMDGLAIKPYRAVSKKWKLDVEPLNGMRSYRLPRGKHGESNQCIRIMVGKRELVPIPWNEPPYRQMVQDIMEVV